MKTTWKFEIKNTFGSIVHSSGDYSNFVDASVVGIEVCRGKYRGCSLRIFKLQNLTQQKHGRQNRLQAA